MLDREINEKIAIKKGWKLLHYLDEFGDDYLWRSPEGDLTDIPNFTGDWRLAGELLEEMARADTRPTVFYCDNFKWSCNWSILEKDGKYYELGGSSRGLYTPQEAIAKAWLMWKGLK